MLIGKSDGPTSVAASLATLVFGFVLLPTSFVLVTRGRRRDTAGADPAVAAPTTATQPGVPT